VSRTWRARRSNSRAHYPVFGSRPLRLGEMIEDTKQAVGAECAIAPRFAVEELRGIDGISAGGEGREVVEMLVDCRICRM
jgi:hypothetical protein